MGSHNSNGASHVLMLPFMAHGHQIPFLSLARKLQDSTNCTDVTIATTALNLRYLRPAAAAEAPKIRLVELPFRGADHGLPPDAENTENLPLNQVVNLFQASASFRDPVERLVEEIAAGEGRLPACIIADIFFGWATEVGRKFGIKTIAFSTGGAYGTLAYVSVWLHLPHRSTDSDEFELPGFPKNCRFHRSQLHRFLRAADTTDPWSKFFQQQISLSLTSDAWACNSIEDLEPFGLKHLRNYVNRPVWPIGPLLPSSFLDKSRKSSPDTMRAGKKSGVSVERCTEWLGRHGPDSVLYISFGSQNTISASQMVALAMGLEASRKPFVWVLRPPLGFDMKGEFRSEWLPQGFEQRVTESNQGLLVRTWAPQLEILSHRSTRAFLSHCGWNSVLESLSQGVAMIGWPMAAEQSYNAKMMVEEMGVCVELTRGVEKEIEWKEVQRVVDLVMENVGKGEEMKRKAVEIGEKIRASVKDNGGEEIKGSSLEAMDEFERFIFSR